MKIFSTAHVEDYLSVRSERAKAMLKVQHSVMSSIRSFLEDRGFIEIAPVILSPVTDPGIRGAETASVDFYGTKYRLTTSMILQKQMLVSALDRIFIFSPCIRLEKHLTKRHLAEFLQVDVEVAHSSRDEIMTLAENLVAAAIRSVKKTSASELGILNRRIKVPRTPFKRIRHQEAVTMARELGCPANDEGELSFEAETALSLQHEEPLWIVDYPVEARGFYYRSHPGNPGELRDFDLIFPEGFGEAISGGEREHRYEVALQRIRQKGLALRDYGWYLNMLHEGIPSSAGFGIGLERLTRYVCGLDDISEATAFPRMPAGMDDRD